MTHLRFALAQIDTCVGDLDGNADKIMHYAHLAAHEGAHVVIFPEMTLTGYPIEDLALRRTFRQAAWDKANELATQLNDVPLQIHREPADAPWLQVETRIVPPGEGHTEVSLQEIANRWNVGHLQPTVFPVEDGESWVLVAASRFFVGEGLSDRQIHAMARRGLIIGLQAAEELPSYFEGSEASAQ